MPGALPGLSEGRHECVGLQALQADTFPFPPSGGPSQVKLIREGTGQWYLLAFRSDPHDDPNGTDYVDVYPIAFEPFSISTRLLSVHIYFHAGNTGSAITGTHYVECSGRLLISSSH
jgi:hypothetical protein